MKITKDPNDRVREYEELTEAEKSELSEAWAKIADGLNTYETLTGADNLDEILYQDLWEAIHYQKEAEND